MFVAVIPNRLAGEAIEEMLTEELIDRSMKIQRSESEVFVPLRSESLPGGLVERFRIRVEEWDDRRRAVREAPFEEIVKTLRERGLGIPLIDLLPDRWEIHGDVITLKLDDRLLPHKSMIAEAYADALRAKTILRDKGTISGEERVPDMELLLGESTEAVHCENGILYCLDAAKIMFSSGNITERMRMASVECDGETVVDMFAGIGYFALPLAVYGRPRVVYACEIRPLSYDYLKKNIKLNRVEEIVEPVLGDCRDFSPPQKVDRIVMGYLRDTFSFLGEALGMLRSGGIIHYHENFPNALLPGGPAERLRKNAGDEWDVEIVDQRVVKTFSPGVSHIVVDARFTTS